MEKFLRTALMVLGIFVLAAMLFSFGVQLYAMLSGPAWASYGPGGMMMAGRGGAHLLGGFGFSGPVLGMALIGLIVAGIVALVRDRGAAPGRPPEPVDAPPAASK